MNLKILESQCDCERCQRMCHAPCCGLLDEMEKLIDNGYADRLMFDDYEMDDEDYPMLKPALKGYEGEEAPFETYSEKGCTFWKNGLCELHNTGLKPFAARYAHHDLTDEEWDSVTNEIQKSWKPSAKTLQVIEKWKAAVEKK